LATLFFDTSALVKLYVREPGTDRVLALAHPDTGNRLAILAIARVELRSAVRRRSREGDLDQAAADALLGTLNQHMASVFMVQSVNDAVIEEANRAIDRHGLRAYDALQLGGFIVARGATVQTATECTFVCADTELVAAARSDGISVIDILVDAE
jgi:predicted nucleic acid-binding protein